jgi:hypothetical protein
MVIFIDRGPALEYPKELERLGIYTEDPLLVGILMKAM